MSKKFENDIFQPFYSLSIEDKYLLWTVGKGNRNNLKSPLKSVMQKSTCPIVGTICLVYGICQLEFIKLHTGWICPLTNRCGKLKI